MSKLRRFEKDVIKYWYLLYGQHQDRPKIDSDACIMDVDQLLSDISLYMDTETIKLIDWCEYNVKNFAVYHSFITRPIFFFWQKIIDHHLNKYSYNLSKAGMLQERVEAFRDRLHQIKAFCSN